MAIDFPSSPALNATYVYLGVTYKWDGQFWVAQLTTLPVISGGTGQTTEAEALGEMLQSLSADLTPDYINDYMLTYDASADTGKKVPLANGMPTNALYNSNILINSTFSIGQWYGDTYFSGNWISPATTNEIVQDQWLLSANATTPGSANLMAGTITTPAPLGVFGNAFYQCGCLQMATAGITPVGSDRVIFGQAIEYGRFKKLGFGYSSGQPVTLSFWVFATKTGTMCVALTDYGTRIYVQEVVITAANTWQYVVLTFPPDTASPTPWERSEGQVAAYVYFIMMAGATLKTQTPGSWQAWSQYATAAQSNFFSAANDRVCLTGVTLLPGRDVALTAALSPLLTRPYHEDFILCQRYIQKIPFGVRWVCVGNGFPQGWPVIFLTPMRAAPSGSITPAGRNNVSSASLTIVSEQAGTYTQIGATGTTDTYAADDIWLDATM